MWPTGTDCSMIGSRNVETLYRLRGGPAGNADLMNVFEYTCSDCGPFHTVPAGDFSKMGIGKAPVRCPRCHGPVSVDIVAYADKSLNDAA